MGIRPNPKKGVIGMAFVDDTEKMIEVVSEIRDLLKDLRDLVKERGDKT